MERNRWYKDAVIYQIYPRSFKDGNGDGIGDIKGIIEKLDYLKFLGVDAVWLSPCYKSPNDDNGYDISDYCDIMTEFGTLQDWQVMIDGMHERGIKLIMDLVVNHCSDEHLWFKSALGDIHSPYRDYFFFRKGKGKHGKKPPNNWTSKFGGSAWSYDEKSQEWFLHLFSKKQPDLNWDNPKVRDEVVKIIDFWAGKGVDGFRCDVITYISKVDKLPNGKGGLFQKGDEMFEHGPNIHKYLHEINTRAWSKYDSMTVGEGPGLNIEQGSLYTDESREELDTVFTFEHVLVDTFQTIIPRKFKLPKLKKVFNDWQLGMRGKGWNSLYLENHDQPRSLPRYVGDFKDNHKLAGKMLAVANFFMQGTPYIFQGQEVGMTNYKFTSLEEFDDVLVRNILSIAKKIPLAIPILRYPALKILNKRARDHARTLMQWSNDENAGFTSAKPWFVINPNYTNINVEKSIADKDSILNFYRQIIQLRRGDDVIKNGSYRQFLKSDKSIYAYERCLNGIKYVIICNFKNDFADFKLPFEVAFKTADVLISNYEHEEQLINRKLRPYEAVVYKLSV